MLKKKKGKKMSSSLITDIQIYAKKINHQSLLGGGDQEGDSHDPPQPVAKPFLDWRTRQLSGQLRPAALPWPALPSEAQPRKGATPHPPTPWNRIQVSNRQL